MDTEHIHPHIVKNKRTLHDHNAIDVSTNISSDENEDRTDLKHTSIKRIFRLLQFLLANECTRQEIFARLAPYYKIDNVAVDRDSSSRSAGRMFERDIKLLQEQGFEIQKIKAKGRPTHYSLVKGTGPALSFLFSEEEVDVLSLLNNLFTDPAKSRKHPHTCALILPPPQSLHNPFAETIFASTNNLSTTLPPAHI